MALQQKFPLAQQEVNVVREAVPLRPQRVTPLPLPLPRGLCSLPAVEPVCLSNKGQSQGASGAELCESLLKMIPMMDLIYSVLELLYVMGSTCLAYIQSTQKKKSYKTNPQATAERQREKTKKKWGAALLLWTLMLIFQFCSFESFTEQKCKTLFFLALGGVVEKKRVICGLDLLICPLRSVILGLDLMICTHVLVWGFILNDTSWVLIQMWGVERPKHNKKDGRCCILHPSSRQTHFDLAESKSGTTSMGTRWNQ